MDLLALHPLCVTRIDGGYACSGNVDLWHLASHHLDPKTDVTCMLEAEQERADDDRLLRRTINELIYLPAFLGPRPRDVDVLYQRHLAAGVVECGPPRRPEPSAFATLYGVDPRSLSDFLHPRRAAGSRHAIENQCGSGLDTRPERPPSSDELRIPIISGPATPGCRFVIPLVRPDSASHARFAAARDVLRARILEVDPGRSIDERLEEHLREASRRPGRPKKAPFATAGQFAVVVDEAAIAMLFIGETLLAAQRESDFPSLVTDAESISAAEHLAREFLDGIQYDSSKPIERLLLDIVTLVEPLLTIIHPAVRPLISDVTADPESPRAAALARSLDLPLWSGQPWRYRAEKRLRFWRPPPHCD